MHQVLLLFFGKFFPDITQFLDADEEQDTFHIRLFTKALQQLLFQLPPPALQVVTEIHAAKMEKRMEKKSF
jgi:hypothetical protein